MARTWEEKETIAMAIMFLSKRTPNNHEPRNHATPNTVSKTPKPVLLIFLGTMEATADFIMLSSAPIPTPHNTIPSITTHGLFEIKAKKESIIEEKTSYKEDNVVSSTIEQLLDYEAKKLSDSQSYSGCLIFNVKDRLQEMIKMKGKDYAIDYMNEHWPKIDLSKVL